jgi:UDP-glucose:(heptosyl)LPS alpha-1,3-glucosyltransferase
MRIALLMKRYSLHRGGGEYDLVRLSTSLLERGHEVHLFVHAVEGEPDRRLHLHRVPMLGFWAPLKILSFAWNAPQVVKKTALAFDVIHAMTQTYPSDLYWNGGGLQINWLPARYGSSRFHSSCACARYQYWLNPRHAANLWVERMIFKPGNYRYVVSLTHMETDQIVGTYRVPPERFRVIPNGIDLSRFHPGVKAQYRQTVRQELGLLPDQILLLFVGTDGIRKGLPQLLEALGSVRSLFNGVLVIAGNDPPSRWEGLVHHNQLTGKVHFLAHEARIERLYAAADVVVMASLFEGYGNVIPEAMACGCPVLTTRQVGAADFVEHGRTGWILDSCRDLEAYTTCLEAIFQKDDLAKMGAQAAEAIAPYTWEHTVDQLEEIYRLIAKESHLRAR